MKKAKGDLDLEYLNRRIDTLCIRFRKLEELIFNWKKQDSIDIDKLKGCLKSKDSVK